MLRPCFLVVDREQFGSISTRKLVIETAKFNVITAYSSSEAIEAAGKFPNVDGVVLDAGIRGMPCSELVEVLRKLLPERPVIVIGDSGRHPCHGETRRLETFDPRQLLDLLQKLEPAKAAAIAVREKELNTAAESLPDDPQP